MVRIQSHLTTLHRLSKSTFVGIIHIFFTKVHLTCMMLLLTVELALKIFAMVFRMSTIADMVAGELAIFVLSSCTALLRFATNWGAFSSSKS